MGYELIRESFPKARKKYRCIWCGESIPIGEKHRHEISTYDGLQDHRWHLECNEDAMNNVFRHGEEEFLPYSAERPALGREAPTMSKAE